MQVDLVCEQLAGIPELADGFNAIGFSQVDKAFVMKRMKARTR